MKKNVFKSWFLFLVVATMISFSVIADEQSTTITYVIPSSIAHSLSYGVIGGSSCSSGAFYFREEDSTTDGYQNNINVTDASGNYCQNQTVDAITFNNDGNDAINLSVSLDSAPLSGVVTRVGQNWTSFPASGCSLTQLITPTDCVNVTNSEVLLFTNMAAAASNTTFWQANFTNANVGAGAGQAGSATRTMTSNATVV